MKLWGWSGAQALRRAEDLPHFDYLAAFREGERRGFIDGFLKGACTAGAGALLVWYLVSAVPW